MPINVVNRRIIYRAPAGLILPPGVTGIIGWWDASVPSSFTFSSSNNIDTVKDQSGSGNTVAWSAGTRPTYLTAGFNSSFPCINFGNANNSGLFKSGFPMGTGNTLTIWFVGHDQAQFSQNNCRAMSYAGNAGVTDNDNNQSFFAGQVGTTITMQLNRNASSATGSFVSDNTPHRFIGTIDSSGVMTAYVDGVANVGSTLNANWGNNGLFALGQCPPNNGNAEWHGVIAEAGISTDFTNSSNVALLDAYLKSKWGM